MIHIEPVESLATATEGYAAPTLALRPMTAGDRSYVVSTWLRSFWATARGREFKGRLLVDYLRTYDARVKAALSAGTKVTIAFDPDYPLVIVGWAAHTGGTLHYVYVRSSVRRQGAARALLASTSGLWAHSHLTPDFGRLLAGGLLSTTYRPNHFNEKEHHESSH